MKFYQSQNSAVGEGVEATVLYHKDNGDELVCIRSGFESFEEQNPDAIEITQEEANQLLAVTTVAISIPVRQEIRTEENKLSQEDILQQIQSEENPTVDISAVEETDPDGNKIQKLTYFEKSEINSVDDFFKVQEAQSAPLEPVIVAPEPQPETDTSSNNN